MDLGLFLICLYVLVGGQGTGIQPVLTINLNFGNIIR